MSLTLSDFAFGLDCLRPHVALIEDCYVLYTPGKERDKIQNVRNWKQLCHGDMDITEYDSNHRHVIDLCLRLPEPYTLNDIRTVTEVYMALLRDELRMKYPDVTFHVELSGDINRWDDIDEAFVTFKCVRK